MSVAQLGLAVDSAPVSTATAELYKFVAAAREAQAAAAAINLSNAQATNGLADQAAKLKQIQIANDNITASINRRLAAVERLTNSESRNNATNYNARAADIVAYAAALDKLQAKFDPIFAAQLRYRKGVEDITNAHKVGALTYTQSAELLVQERRAMEATINTLNDLANARKRAAQTIVNSQTIIPNRGADAEAAFGLGGTADEIRRQIDQRYDAIRSYQDYAAKVRDAQAKGIVDADNATAAIKRQRQATLELLAAQRAMVSGDSSAGNTGGTSLQQHGFNVQNAAFQLQDIGVTTAMGMNPWMIGLQQGTQLAPAFSGQSPGQAVKTIGEAFASVVSPVSLLTIGIIGLTAAAVQYFTGVNSGTKTTEDALREHEELIRRIGDRYKEVARGAKEYGQQSSFVLQQEANDQQRDLARRYSSAVTGFYGATAPSQSAYGMAFGATDQQLAGTGVDRYRGFRDLLDNFDKSNRSAEEFIKLRDQIAQRANGDPALQKLGKELSDAADDAYQIALRFPQAADAVKDLSMVAGSGAIPFRQYAESMRSLLDMSPLGAQRQTFIDQSASIDRELANARARAGQGGISEAARDARVAAAEAAAQQAREEIDGTRARREATQDYAIEIQQIHARTTAQIADVAATRARTDAIRAGKSDIDAETAALRASQAVWEQRAQALKDAAQAREQGRQERFAGAQLQIDTFGMSSPEIARQQYILDAMNEARREAMQYNGTDAVSPERIRQIEAEADAWAKLQKQIQDLNEANARRDFSVDIQALHALTLEQQAAIAAQRAYNQAIDAGMGIENAAAAATRARTLAIEQARVAQESADRQRYMTVRQNFEAAQLELNSIGMSSTEYERLQYIMREVNAERERNYALTGDASVSQARIDQITKEADAWSKLKEAISQARLQQDQIFRYQQNGRSSIDREVYSTMNQYGLLDKDGNITGQTNQALAAQIRLNAQVEEFQGLWQGAGKEIAAAWTQGKDGMEVLENRLKNMIANYVGGWIDDGLNKLTTGLFPQLSKVGITAPVAQGATPANPLWVSVVGGAGFGLTTGSTGAGIGTNPDGSRAAGAAIDRASVPGYSATSIEGYIRNAAMQRGIDPNVAVAVAKSEGGLNSWNLQSGVMKNGMREQSFGPYQLYMGGGLGNVFQAQTGLDPRDAANGPAGVDFALDYAKKNGWGSWYGAANSGIGNWEGISKDISAASSTITKGANELAGATTAAANAGSGFSTGLADVTKMITSGAGSAAGAAGGDGGGLLGGLFGFVGKLFGGLFGSANGNAFYAHSIIPFANGGIVDSPMLFPMSGGTGMMGEAGPEAIMPLKRGPDGKLGVSSGRNGGGDRITNHFDLRGSTLTEDQVDAKFKKWATQVLGTAKSQSASWNREAEAYRPARSAL